MKFGLFLAAHDILGTKGSVEQVYEELIEQAVLAEELGYDYVWLAEHDLVRFISMPDALQMAVLIGSRTSRIKIGISVFVTPFHHPLLLAGDISQADVLIGGRLEVAFARGGSRYQLRAAQAYRPSDELRARNKEFVEIVEKAWSSPHAIDYDGEFFSFANAYVVPRPASKPYPRIWAPAIGAAGSVARAAASGKDMIFGAHRHPFEVIEAAAKEFYANGGHQPTPFGHSEMLLQSFTYVAPTMDQAYELLPIIDYHEHVIQGGLQDREAVVDGVREWQEGVEGRTEEEYKTNLPLGDPEHVLAHISRYRDLGVDQYVSYMSMGQPQADVTRSMRLFAEHVIPALR